VDLDADLNILEVRITADAQGVNATLTVSDGDRYPFSDAELQAAQLAEGRLYEAHPQLSIAYAPVGPYTRRVDATHNADFIVRIGIEVTALNYAILRWKSGPLISSVKSTAAAGGGGSTVTSASGGGATVTSAGGGSVTSLAVSDSSVSDSGGPEGIYGSRTSSESPDDPHDHNVPHDHSIVHNHTLTLSNHTHSVTVADHTHTLTNTYGIYQDTVNPTSISIYINGVDRTAALGGPWAAGGAAADDELDITTYLVNASGGLRQNHTISFRCASGQGEVEVEVDMLVTLQAIAVV
jgi:hypothetical protein